MGGPICFHVGKDRLSIDVPEHLDRSFQVAQLKDRHPGFQRQIHGYVTDDFKWDRFGQTPKEPAEGTWPAVTTPGVMWKGRIVVPTGEARPGVRTPRVLWAKPLGWTN